MAGTLIFSTDAGKDKLLGDAANRHILKPPRATMASWIITRALKMNDQALAYWLGGSGCPAISTDTPVLSSTQAPNEP